MKYIFLLLFPISLFGQLSGIPEQDSLLTLKDKLFLKNQLCNDCCLIEYEWVHFQWLQWVKGKKEHLCVFSSRDGIYYSECGIDPGFYPNYVKDTLIHLPQPISFEEFMKFKISKIN